MDELISNQQRKLACLFNLSYCLMDDIIGLNSVLKIIT